MRGESAGNGAQAHRRANCHQLRHHHDARDSIVAETFALYTAIQQPVPLRLPAMPAAPGADPEDLGRCLFDLHAAETAFREALALAYAGALAGLREMAAEGGSLSVSVCSGFLEMAGRWTSDLVRSIQHLLREPTVEPVATDAHYGLLFAFDVWRLMRTMAKAREDLARLAGRPIRSAEVSGFAINHEVYLALANMGFATMAAEGEARVTDGRQPGHLGRWGEGPVVLYRLQWLSDELDYHLRTGDPQVEGMAETVARLPGEVALVSFSFDSLSLGAGRPEGGVEVLASLAAACLRRGVEPVTLGEAAARYAARAAYHAPPTLTAMSGPSLEGMGRDGWAQQLIFGRMQQAHAVAQLVESQRVREMGDWLLHPAHLSLPALACAGAGARPGTYSRSRWWEGSPSHDETTAEVLSVYDNFIRAAACYVRQP